MSLATDIHSRICEVANDGVHGLDRAELVPEIRRLVCEVAPLTPSGEIAEVVDEVMAHVDGLGPLHHLALESGVCLLYTSPSPRDRQKSRMPSSA